jgi:hypothetical protein
LGVDSDRFLFEGGEHIVFGWWGGGVHFGEGDGG